MGEQVNIYELAERMIRLCGLRPARRHRDPDHRPAPGREAGRDGGRAGRVVVAPRRPSVLSIAPVRLDADRLRAALDHLDALAVAGDHAAAREALLGLARPPASSGGASSRRRAPWTRVLNATQLPAADRPRPSRQGRTPSIVRCSSAPVLAVDAANRWLLAFSVAALVVLAVERVAAPRGAPVAIERGGR